MRRFTLWEVPGIELLEHSMKVWEHILLSRLKEFVFIDPQQLGFQTGRSTFDVILNINQLQEKNSAKNKTLCHIFVDLEKAFDKIPRKAVKWDLRKKGVPERLIKLVSLLYDQFTSKVKVACVFFLTNFSSMFLYIRDQR